MNFHLRPLSVFLILLLLLSFIGCQRDTTDPKPDRQPTIPTGVWEMSAPLTLPGDSTPMSGRGFARGLDGEIYCTAAKERFSTETLLLRYAPDGTFTALPYPDGGFASTPPYLTSHVNAFTLLPGGGFATIFDIGQGEMLVITDADNQILAQAEMPHFGVIDTVNMIVYALCALCKRGN